MVYEYRSYVLRVHRLPLRRPIQDAENLVGCDQAKMDDRTCHGAAAECFCTTESTSGMIFGLCDVRTCLVTQGVTGSVRCMMGRYRDLSKNWADYLIYSFCKELIQ